MKNFSLLLSLLWASACFGQGVTILAPAATIAAPTCWKTDDQGASATTITVSVSPTGGSGHVLVGFVRAATGQPFSFSDNSGSNTWNSVSLNNTGTVGSWGEGYVQNAAAGTYTVTGTLNGSGGSRSITVCEIAGVLSSSALDSGATTAGSCASATSCTTSTFTTANAHEFIIVMGTNSSVSNVFTAGSIGGSTSTLITTVANDSFGEYLAVTTVQTSITAAISGTGTVTWGYVVAAFKTP